METLSCTEIILWVSCVCIPLVLCPTASGGKYTSGDHSSISLSEQLHTYGSVNYFYRVTSLLCHFCHLHVSWLQTKDS